MDPTGRFTMQQQIKIIKAYFTTKSVLLTQLKCRRGFGKNNVSDRRTIQRLMAKFRETGSVADAHKCHSGRHRSNRSNPTSQGHFQSFDGYLHKMFLFLLYFDQFASTRSEFYNERA